MAKAPAKKKKKEVVLTPAEKFQQYKTLMRATRCIIKVTDEYKIFLKRKENEKYNKIAISKSNSVDKGIEL